MSPGQTTHEFRRYETWSHSAASASFLTDLYAQHGATSPRPVFRLLMIVAGRRGSDERRLAAIARSVVSFPLVQRRLWLTIVDELGAAQSVDGLDSPMWHVMDQGAAAGNRAVGATVGGARRSLFAKIQDGARKSVDILVAFGQGSWLWPNVTQN